MKKRIVQAANSILVPCGAKIVSIKSGSFDMKSAIERIAAHSITIRSVIDIGASDGTWSVEAMDIFPKASFLGIEPLLEWQKSLERLKRNRDNFDYALCVAGETDGGHVTMNVADDLVGSSVEGTGGKRRSVPVRSVDALVSEKNLSGPFLLKFDTHGYEVPILNGAKNTLAQTNVIVMEVYCFTISEHSLRFHEICHYMEGLGFRCYDIACPILREYDQAFWQMDMLFARTDSDIFRYAGYR